MLYQHYILSYSALGRSPMNFPSPLFFSRPELETQAHVLNRLPRMMGPSWCKYFPSGLTSNGGVSSVSRNGGCRFISHSTSLSVRFRRSPTWDRGKSYHGRLLCP